MERKLFGFTMADVMRLAYQLAVRNGIKNKFCKRNEKAGRKWLKNFLRRHTQISVRTSEGVSLSRARGFTPESVAQFFETYEPAVDTIQHKPARLYNCDETGITIVQHKHTKILGLTGKRQISSLQSAERGFLVTVVICMSPTGHFIPPLLVFKKNETRSDEWPTAWINPRVPSLGVDTERDIFPVVSSFHQTYKANKRRSYYLSTGRALFTHQEPGGHYFGSRESC